MSCDTPCALKYARGALGQLALPSMRLGGTPSRARGPRALPSGVSWTGPDLGRAFCGFRQEGLGGGGVAANSYLEGMSR